MTTQTGKNGITRLAYEQWKKRATELFGEDPMDWVFICPMCGHVQSANSVVEKNPNIVHSDAIKWVFNNCVGRYGIGGCNYTAYGLINVCKTAVEKFGGDIPVFEFTKLPFSYNERSWARQCDTCRHRSNGGVGCDIDKKKSECGSCDYWDKLNGGAALECLNPMTADSVLNSGGECQKFRCIYWDIGGECGGN